MAVCIDLSDRYRTAIVAWSVLLTFHLGLPVKLVKADEAVRRIAVVACHRQDRPSPALVRYIEAKPDLTLWIGDNVYADTETDPQFIQACYKAMEAKPEFRGLREISPFMVTWDDHDFGLNDVGGDYRFKQESKAIFRKFWQLETEIPEHQSGIYYAKLFTHGGHSLQVILLDPRYNRDAPGEHSDTLGEKQWQWLAGQLQVPATLRLLVSGYQVLLERGTGSETWADFPEARERLFRLIRESRASGIVLITGDQHYAEVCRLRGAVGYDAVELQFAGINQNEEPEYNPNRVSPVARALHKYCLLDIQWEQTEFDPPHLLFQVFDAQANRPEVIYRVNFSELDIPLESAAESN